MSTDRVNVPRVHLEEWFRVLAILTQGEHLGRNARDQLTTVVDDIHFWSTQRTDLGGVNVSQTMGVVEQGSTVVGFVSHDAPSRRRESGR
jgi:hypothetical protein